MEIALSILERYIGTSFPNPTVVALIVESDKDFKNSKIISFGITQSNGRPHAEANAILKTAKSNHNCSGATLYLTHSPCKDCSKLIHQAGIKRLVYIDQYKDLSGLEFLNEAGVEIREVSKKDLFDE